MLSSLLIDATAVHAQSVTTVVFMSVKTAKTFKSVSAVQLNGAAEEEPSRTERCCPRLDFLVLDL